MNIITIEQNGEISHVETIIKPAFISLYNLVERENTKFIGSGRSLPRIGISHVSCRDRVLNAIQKFVKK